MGMNRLGIRRGLRSSDFRLIAKEGFGDGLNSYAHTMTWFKGRLYVTTMRGCFALMRLRLGLGLDVWPVDCPLDPFELDLRAEIWAYDPLEDAWERVFKAPWITGSDGSRIPRDISYRAATVHRDPESGEEKLFISTWSPAKGPGPVIMCTEDGRNFKVTCEPGLCGLPVTTIRSLVSFKGRLYTTPVGSRGGNTNISAHSVVYESRHPETGDWQPVSDFGFGDITNLSLLECTSWGDHLYASTGNNKGFQLWRSTCEGEPPYHWEQVLRDGCGRGSLNQGGTSLYPFRDALYIGTGIQRGGNDKENKIGPAGSELIRLNKDLSWDLIVGDPKDTPDGRKEPKSGRYAGFDQFFNGYFWRMAEHDGWLYLGTFEWSSVLGYISRSRWPRVMSNLIARVGPQKILEYGSGFDLYRSRDGDNWVPVTTNGMDNPYNMGMRTICSTPYGLFLGTANPWGPRIMPLDGRNRFVHNPRGGCEVFFARNLA
jgi:hypothetical protein